MGAENVAPENGRVLCAGSPEMIARANIRSRFAERVLVLLGTFEAKSFESLFRGVKALPWTEWIGRDDAFPVKGRCLSSQLMSVPDCQAIIKKAVVESLKEAYKLEHFPETGANYQIQFLIMKDKVSIMLDTSGAGLHKRGYRKNSNEAPIKETLAAVMAKLSRVRTDGTLIDPFCLPCTLRPACAATLRRKSGKPSPEISGTTSALPQRHLNAAMRAFWRSAMTLIQRPCA